MEKDVDGELALNIDYVRTYCIGRSAGSSRNEPCFVVRGACKVIGSERLPVRPSKITSPAPHSVPATEETGDGLGERA